ncbi:MAG: hypothetical protein LUP97_03055 [Methanoregula sp.]|nr:hypothetical protein [Methanoregula sp.]
MHLNISFGISILFIAILKEGGKTKLPLDPYRQQKRSQERTLLQVIIVILAVNVLEDDIIVGSEALKWEALIIPAAVLLLAASHKRMHGTS